MIRLGENGFVSSDAYVNDFHLQIPVSFVRPIHSVLVQVDNYQKVYF